MDCNIITLEDKQKEILESIVEKLKNTECVINIEEKINQLKNSIDETRNDKIKIVNGSNNTFDIYNESHNPSPESEKTGAKQYEHKILTNCENKHHKLHINKGEKKIEIEFCNLKSKQDFKKAFSNIKSKIKHGRLNTILQDKNLSLESKILNITCNGRTYKGVNDVWDIENNYSDYNESHSITPQSLESSLQTQKNKSRCLRIMARKNCPIRRNKY